MRGGFIMMGRRRNLSNIYMVITMRAVDLSINVIGPFDWYVHSISDKKKPPPWPIFGVHLVLFPGAKSACRHNVQKATYFRTKHEGKDEKARFNTR